MRPIRSVATVVLLAFSLIVFSGYQEPISLEGPRFTEACGLTLSRYGLKSEDLVFIPLDNLATEEGLENVARSCTQGATSFSRTAVEALRLYMGGDVFPPILLPHDERTALICLHSLYEGTVALITLGFDEPSGGTGDIYGQKLTRAGQSKVVLRSRCSCWRI